MLGKETYTWTCIVVTRNMVCLVLTNGYFLHVFDEGVTKGPWAYSLSALFDVTGDYIRYAPNRVLMNTPQSLQGNYSIPHF